MPTLEDEEQSISEPFAVPEIFAQGVASVEDMGDGYLCMTFYRRQNGERIAAGRLLICKAGLARGRQLTDAAIAAGPVRENGEEALTAH